MFVMKTSTMIKGKKYDHYKLAESYKENGKVKHRILHNFGNLPEETAERIKAAIAAYSNPDMIIARKDEIVVTKNIRYLDIAVLHFLWKEWGFDQFFKGYKWVETMVLNRCLNPKANINVKEWVCQTALPYMGEIDITEYNKFDIYRDLDKLNRKESELQQYIFKKVESNEGKRRQTLYYDITSSYFEGSTCIIARHGYSREHRPDLVQIEIALLVAEDGCPYYWQVLEGNIHDMQTVKSLVDSIKSKFGIRDCTLVFDRGMASEENLQYIRENGYSFVSGLDAAEIRKLKAFDEVMPEAVGDNDYDMIMAMRGFVAVDEDHLLYGREINSDGWKYIFSFDVSRFLADRKTREKTLKQVSDWLDKKNTELVDAKRSRDKEKLFSEVARMLKNHHVSRMVKFALEEIKVPKKQGMTGKELTTYHIRCDVDVLSMAEVARMDGLTCFVAQNTSELDKEKVISMYRDKNKVEEAFRELKSCIDLRPMRLTREERVRAHVSACVLAYLIINDLDNRLMKTKLKITSGKYLEKLSGCMINLIDIQEGHDKSISLTKTTQEQEELLDCMGLYYLTGTKYTKQVFQNVVTKKFD